MEPNKSILNEEFLIADGAMGTWYVNKYQKPMSACESDNIDNPAIISEIHESYLQAGARMLRTNTFSVIQPDSDRSPEETAAVFRAGYQIAAGIAKNKAYAAVDFGPVYGMEAKEYLPHWEKAVQSVTAVGADLFILETFSDPAEMKPLCEIIRKYCPQAVIIASFSVSPDGYTHNGLSLIRLNEQIEENESVDIFGLNCGVGPTHLRKLLAKLPKIGKPLSLMPNSGYPRAENQRMIFGSTPEYFASRCMELYHPRLLILGGCCGTTPDHIKALSEQIIIRGKPAKPEENKGVSGLEAEEKETVVRLTPSLDPLELQNKLQKGKFLFICELDPPKNSDLHQMTAAALMLADCGVDAITIADSPLARVKLDPVIAGSRITRETGLPVLPHLTCRDRNANALRSLMLGAHSEGIRQILAITGDRIAESDRGFVKPVFNFNSIGLLKMADQMNQEVFAEEPLLLAAAADLGSVNPQAELRKIRAKQAAGARLFLTQPVYQWNDEIRTIAEGIRESGSTLLLGLMPLVSLRNASYMDQEVPGIRIPAEILNSFRSEMTRQESEDTGLEQILQIAGQASKYVDGFYLITPFNRAGIMKKFMQRFTGGQG